MACGVGFNPLNTYTFALGKRHVEDLPVDMKGEFW
jgi:hypothetical protein